MVDVKLAETWSPEQISGYLKVNGQPTVGHESIYQRIYADKRARWCSASHPALPEGAPETLRRCARRGTIPNQVSIDLRPAIVAERASFGDWEADLVIGAGQKQALVTINERTSRYSLIAHVPFKTAQAVSDTMISLLTPFAASVHTLTTDNGKEFAQHERIAGNLDADFFFAHPYASWERGANENMNGLIRQFFPKKMLTATKQQGSRSRIETHQPFPAPSSSFRRCASFSAILPSSPRGVGWYQCCSGRSSGK